jgi:serine/threonine protein kinase
MIGQGGMAEVWQGTLSGIGGFERDVAVKLLLPQYSTDAEFVDMLLDEARIAASIAFSNVVQVLDVGRDGDRFYLVMEYVGGTDLRGLLRRTVDGRLGLEHALFVTSEIAKGLEAVHSAKVRGVHKRIIHRDISPSNILLSASGEVKLADFGIAHAAQRLTRTRAGSVKGKTRYMSPEQLSGQRLDGRSDLYSLAVVLAEILIGPSVFPQQGEGAPGRARILAEAQKAMVPDDVIALLRNALAARPEQRPTDAAEFGLQCADLLHRRVAGYDQRRLTKYVAQGDGGVVRTMAPPAESTGGLEEQPTRQSGPVGFRGGLAPAADGRRLAVGTELVPVRLIPLVAGSRM